MANEDHRSGPAYLLHRWSTLAYLACEGRLRLRYTPDDWHHCAAVDATAAIRGKRYRLPGLGRARPKPGALSSESRERSE